MRNDNYRENRIAKCDTKQQTLKLSTETLKKLIKSNTKW